MEAKKEYRGIPFWSWNGILEKQEIIRQVYVLKEMGFGGFFMHSRTGLATEYLGEEWFGLIRIAAEEGKALGMDAWLYDEDRWPSGTAGGEVTKTPAYQMKFISMYDGDSVPADGVHIAGELGRFAVKLNERNELEDYYPIKEGEPVKVGYVVKKFLIEHMKPQEFYNGYTYLDTLNREATDAFLASTHEKYRKHCGDLFGNTLKGIFADEPHRGAVLNGFISKSDNTLNLTPYAYGLYERFEKVCGEDLSGKLPELYFKRADSAVNRTMYHYIESLQQLFLENFAIPYHEWCQRNNLLATGHVLHEDSLAIQTIFQGSVQRYYEHMDCPGVDILTEGNNAYWVAKQVQSVARQTGKKFVLSELYGATGWQFNFRSHRDVGAWQTVLGVNLRCHHLSWYTMEGQAKRDYPASIFYQSGWYRDYSYVEDYFARLGELTSKGKPLCSTLVINPVESMWLYPRAGWEKNFFELQLPECRRLEALYTCLFHILVTGQVDFDYGDEDILSRLFRIETNGGSPELAVGEARYTTVVVSGMDTIRSSTLNILRDFAAVGGEVLFIGDLPGYVDAQPADLPAELMRSNKRVAMEREEILSALSGHRLFTIDSEDIMTAVRKEGDTYYLICLNTDREHAKENLTLRFQDRYNIEEIKLDRDREYGVAENSDRLPVRFEAGECRVFRIFASGKILPLPKAEHAVKETLLDGPFAYTLSERNVLPLDMASYVFDGEASDGVYEILRIDCAVRDQASLPRRGGEMIQPWYRKKYGIAAHDSKRHELKLRYRFNVKEIPETDLVFVTEQSERWQIEVNGKALPNTVVGHWIDACFDEIPLPAGYLKEGTNEIVLTAAFDDALNLESTYLLGDFGVELQGREVALTRLPEKLNLGDVTQQGLPFYSGSITYYTGIVSGRVSINLGGCQGAVAKVKDRAHAEYIAYAPYESKPFDIEGELAVEVVLTRRNTFGPLHYAPVLAGAYGPEIFLPEGKDYTDSYSLISQGLLNGLTVKYY